MNLLVAKNYTLTDHSKWHKNRTAEVGLVDNYKKMQELMVASASKNILDLDNIIVHTGECTDIRDVFVDHYWKIKTLHEEGHNILYCDLDVLFVSPATWFTWDKFMMFNYTQPKKLHEGIWKFDNFFNCGIRYYPATMSKEVWTIGDNLFTNFDKSKWNIEQRIYNQMLWSQNISLEQALQPKWAYQDISNTHNKINISEALAIHFHGSRGSEKKLKEMERYD